MAITGIILHGGRSTRMGTDKGALMFGDETLAERIVRLVRTVASDVIVVGRRDQQTPANVTVIYDAIENLGPLAGIAAGLGAAGTDVAVVVACDMPLVRPAVLARLLASIGDHDACVAVVDGHASALCGVYRKRVAADALALLESGERRVMALLDRVRTKRVDAAAFRDIDPDLETFVSVDTPDKFQRALKLAIP